MLVMAAAIMSLTACSASDIEYQQQYDMNKQAILSTGMPAIQNFAERRQLKRVYEERDHDMNTVTYILDMQGNLHKICDSVGYGIPYSTQYSNPTDREPNSLYPPTSANGTWVQCLSPGSRQIKDVYIEPDVVVSPYSLK